MPERSAMIDDVPLRPFLWLRRGAVACVVAAAALTCERLIVGHVASNRLRDAEASLARVGVPLSVAALERPPVDDADNAAVLYRQAFAVMSKRVDSPRSSIHDDDVLGAAPARTLLWRMLADGSERANGAAFGLARRARGVPRVDWNVRFASPIILSALPSLHDHRQLANVLADGAERSFLAGDWAGGLERIRDLRHLAGATVADRPSLVAALVSIGIENVAASALTSQIGTLQIGNGPGMASPAQVRALIGELLEPSVPGNWHEASRMEAFTMLDSAKTMLTPTWILRPIFDADVARLARGERHNVDAADATTLADRDAHLTAFDAMSSRPKPGWSSVPPRASRPLTWRLMVPTNNVPRAADSALVARHVSALQLAMRWYALDHAGRWPATLDALVPTYLPAVPTSPLNDVAGPYGYALAAGGLPDGRDRPLLVKDARRPANPTTLPASADDRRQNIADLTTWSPKAAAVPATAPAR